MKVVEDIYIYFFLKFYSFLFKLCHVTLNKFVTNYCKNYSIVYLQTRNKKKYADLMQSCVIMTDGKKKKEKKRKGKRSMYNGDEI